MKASASIAPRRGADRSAVRPKVFGKYDEEDGVCGIDREDGELSEDEEVAGAAEGEEEAAERRKFIEVRGRKRLVAAERAGSENEEEKEEESGEREVKKVKDLTKPSPDKIEAHERTHLPFRSWCEACVKCRGKEEACRKVDGAEGVRNLPEVHFDFCFPKHEDEHGMTVLCGRERDTRMTLASTVPSKSTGEFAAKRVVAFLRDRMRARRYHC